MDQKKTEIIQLNTSVKQCENITYMIVWTICVWKQQIKQYVHCHVSVISVINVNERLLSKNG
jgi:hypothetical protein